MAKMMEFDSAARESLRRGVVAAEDEHVRRLAFAAALRRENQELGSELYDQQVMARRIFGGAYPDQVFELVRELHLMAGLTSVIVTHDESLALNEVDCRCLVQADE